MAYEKNITLLLLSTVLIRCRNESSKNGKGTFPVLTRQYIGQEKPTLQPKLFAPEIISTGKYELNDVISPDYSEFYYPTRVLTGQIVIMYMKYINERWTEAEVISFLGTETQVGTKKTVACIGDHFTDKANLSLCYDSPIVSPSVLDHS